MQTDQGATRMYGETGASIVQRIAQEAGMTETDRFLDIGAGLNQLALQVGGRVGGWVGEWVDGWVGGRQADGCAGEWVGGWVLGAPLARALLLKTHPPHAHWRRQVACMFPQPRLALSMGIEDIAPRVQAARGLQQAFMELLTTELRFDWVGPVEVEGGDACAQSNAEHIADADVIYLCNFGSWYGDRAGNTVTTAAKGKKKGKGKGKKESKGEGRTAAGDGDGGGDGGCDGGEGASGGGVGTDGNSEVELAKRFLTLLKDGARVVMLESMSQLDEVRCSALALGARWCLLGKWCQVRLPVLCLRGHAK